MFERLFRFLSKDLAMDLGTANTLIYLRGKGVVLNEPSVVAINQDSHQVIAVGQEARNIIGRHGQRIATIRPLKDGVIADFEVTSIMIKYFLAKILKGRQLFRPRLVVAVPTGITSVEKRAVIEAAEQAGARQIHLVEEPMAAAIGAGLPITEPVCNMVVDIGGGTTEVAVISLAGIVFSRSVRVGGDKMDLAVLQHIKRQYNLLIGERTAEHIKTTIGNAYPVGETETMLIKGRDLVSGIPKTVEINSDEIRESIQEQVDSIVETIKIALEQTPPELAADIVDRGIVLTGGGALLKGLDHLLRLETGLPITITEDPLSTVVLGSGKALEEIEILKQVLT
jgi:rod shape-determining protein MreB